MPTISVCITSYNHEKYIKETITSVLNQTYQDFEIIIVDDGSTDETVKVIKTFDDPRINFIRFERNQSACVALQTCIKEARGKYIAILNSDDVFYPDKLEKQVKYLENHTEIAAVFTHAQLIDENSNNFDNKSHFYYQKFDQNNRSRYEWLNYFFYNGNCLCHPSLLIRKDCYKRLGYYDLRMAQLPDFDFWVKLCLNYEIHIIPEKLVKFRIRDNEKNASADTLEARKRSVLEFVFVLQNFLNIKSIDEFVSIFPDNPYNDQLYEEFIPFYLAKMALEVGGIQYNFFGLSTLFKFFKENDKVNKLQKVLNISYRDLIKDTGEIDALNVTNNYILEDLAYIISNEKPKITKGLNNPKVDYIKFLLMSNAVSRPILIWGTGSVGKKLYGIMKESNINIFGFLDSDASKWGKELFGKVTYPYTILENNMTVKQPYVLIGSSYIEEIEESLNKMGLRKDIDYCIGS